MLIRSRKKLSKYEIVASNVQYVKARGRSIDLSKEESTVPLYKRNLEKDEKEQVPVPVGFVVQSLGVAIAVLHTASDAGESARHSLDTQDTFFRGSDSFFFFFF